VTELSGPWSFFGTACTQGMKFSEKKINASGGVLGRPLQFDVLDNQTNPAQAAAASRKFDVQDKVLALSGTTSSDIALAMYGYAEQNKVPFFVPVAAFPQLTKPGSQYTFRIEPDAVGWGYALIKFVESRKAGAKVALMYSDFALMRAISAGIKYQAKKSGITVTADVVFPPGSNDATVQATQVIASKPDYVVTIGAGAFDNTITAQLLDLGLKPGQIIHPFGSTSQMVGWTKRSVGSLYGTFFDANLDNVTAEGQQFVKDFTADVDRIPSYVENYCYVTPQIIKAAIEKAGAVDRDKFRDALRGLKMTESTSGVPIQFDKNGARKEYMYFMEITDVQPKSYKSKKLFYIEWDPEVLPVYDLVK
jgi:branched-chain amino acid transport system substrate-binding protein/urea transport system substrate-binding protein